MKTDNALVALGRIAAIERTIAVLIATHPAPNELAACWRDLAPGWRADLQSTHADAPAFLQAAGKGLDRFERTINAAASAKR